MNNKSSIHDVFKLYSEQSIGIKLFIRLRHILSPLTVLEHWIPRVGRILDLGCGHGLFTNYMALKSLSRKLIGIDPSEQKINVAMKTESRVPNVHYLLGDIHDISEDNRLDVITIVDVLYLLPEGKQKEIIRASYHLLNKFGKLILKTNDTEPLWRFAWTYLQEKIMVNLNLTFGDKTLHFLPVRKTKKILVAAGFHVEHHQLPSRLLYPSVVFVCRREGPGIHETFAG